MTTKIETLRNKVAELEVKFNANPNGKTAKALSDTRKELTDAEFEYRVSPEGKAQERKEIVDAVNEMAKKHMDLQKGVRQYL